MSETGLHVTGVASREWGYNTRGELISEDSENRLTQVAVGGGGGTVSYRYDPFGRRIARILGNITEVTLYDGWNPVAEYANTPQSTTISLKRTFVWGLDVSGSLQGAGGVGGLLAIREAAGNGSSKAGQAIFPAYDGNGNIIRLTDSNGATVASYAYDGFGNRINPAASDIDSSGYANENRYGFSTKPRDPLTGLLYYGYRWYDPAMGRWPSRDPIEESGGLNLYGFVMNNSVGRWDYLGLEDPVKVQPKPIDIKGFNDDRLNKHDGLIRLVVGEFNRDKKKFCGCLDGQVDKIPDLTPELIKAWMIQESGGEHHDRSRAAWEVDPAQVNVPGDWNKHKEDLGLKKPEKRNEGDVATNLRAAVMYLCRKGFGISGQPARNRPSGVFDGWREAIRRYNGRSDERSTGNAYSDDYADQIMKRANNPGVHVPIQLPD